MATNHPLRKPSQEILSLTLYEELCGFPKELDIELPPHDTQHFADKASDGSGTLRLRGFLTGQYWHRPPFIQQEITFIFALCKTSWAMFFAFNWLMKWASAISALSHREGNGWGLFGLDVLVVCKTGNYILHVTRLMLLILLILIER